MKSGTSNWNISFAVHNLLTFALVIGLQNHFLYKITKTLTVVAVALPQTQAVVGTTAGLVESFQFNAFDTTRTTSASSSLLSSSASTFQGTGDTQKPSILSSSSSSSSMLLSSASLESSVAYPTSTTLFAFHNTKTSRIMSNSKSISPTSTTTMTQTTFKTSSSITSNSGASGSTTKLAATQQNSLSSSSSSGGGAGSGLSLFKNIMKSSSTITASNRDSSSSSTSTSSDNGKQQFPLDFTFSKNHWTISDAAFSGGMGAGIVATGAAGGGGSGSSVTNHRLASSSAATSSSSSSISAYSSSSSSSVTETERPRIFRNKHHHERHWGPFFEEPLNSTTSGDNSITTAHLYTEAVLNCRVGMLKDKTVMWVRRTAEKVSLLTVGNITYSSDPRIRVKFQYPNNWRLLINPTQWDDAGVYMCQVSTHPPRVFTTNLTVIEPPLRLIDDQERDVGDRYYKTGSTIDLQCQVSRSFLYKEKQNILKSLKPLNVYNTSGSNNSISDSKTSRNPNTLSAGFSSNKNQTKTTSNKNNKNYGGSSATDSNDLYTKINNKTSTIVDQQGISLEDEFSSLVFWSKDDEEIPSTAFTRISSNDKWLTSRVTITDAKLSDTGNYSCSIGRLFTAIVQVQVLTGELPAAVQHNSAAVTIVYNTSIRQLIQLCWIYITVTYFVVN